MPILSRPTGPRRLWSRSPECRRYSSGPGVPFVPFGLVFSLAGLYLIAAAIWTALSFFGTAAGYDGLDFIDALLRVVGLLVFGSAFVIAGSILLWTLRSTLDRARDLIVVRSGYLGLRHYQRHLSEFRSIDVRPGRKPRGACGRDEFEIVLRDAGGAEMVVGYASGSLGPARDVADDIAEFTKLPMSFSSPFVSHDS